MQAPIRKALGLAVMLGLGIAATSQAQAATCSYAVTNEWNTGFTGSITITNNTSAAINGWTVGWQYSANRMTSSYNATVTGSNPYSATGLSWNSTIQPGQSVSFGFQGDKNNSSSAEKPTVTGSVCSGSTSSTAASSTPASSKAASSTPASSKAASSTPASSKAASSTPASSKAASSTPASSKAASSSSIASGGSCNWYGQTVALCVTTTSGWGYENGASCVARATCAALPAPYGIIGGNTSTAASSTPASVAASSTPASSKAASSTPTSVAASSTPASSKAASSTPASSKASSSSTSSVTTAGTFRVDSSGNITKNGTIFPVKCGNWFGLEGQYEPKNAANNPGGAPMELYVGNMWWAATGRTIQQTMTEIKAQGINMVRLPISPQTLDPTDPQGIGDIRTGGVLKNDASVRQTNARQAMEDFIKLAATNGIQVLIDIHSCSNYVGWRKGRLDARPPYVDATRENYTFLREDWSCASSGNPSTVTHIQAYNESKWLANLQDIAGLSAKLGVDNIIGIDLFNEPWDYTWSDWKTLSEHAYSAINAVNPNVLIFVEGVSGSANNQDGTPTTKTDVPYGNTANNPNWGENLYGNAADPISIPKERLVFSPHTYGPSVFVQRQFMDPSQVNCVGLEGDAAAALGCKIVIDQTTLSAGWEEHFGYLRSQGYAVVVGEFGGNMDWPKHATLADQQKWAHITTNVDQQWQQAFVSYAKSKNIQGCYWSINPESGDTGGWYLHAYDPSSNPGGWGTWLGFDSRKTSLLSTFWAN